MNAKYIIEFLSMVIIMIIFCISPFQKLNFKPNRRKIGQPASFFFIIFFFSKQQISKNLSQPVEKIKFKLQMKKPKIILN